MSLPLVLTLLWFVAANLLAMIPSRDHHWRRAYALIAVGVPLLGWVSTVEGPIIGILAFAAGAVAYLVASLARWPRSGVAIASGLVGLAALIVLAAAGGTDNAALFAWQLVLAALALGAVNASMLLGHWYLVTPRLPEAHEQFVTIPPRVWKLMLGVGALVWIVAAVITEVTNDNILVPTVIIVGSFMVPVTVAAFALSREREGYLTTEEVVLGFLGAGTLGVVTTALLEIYLLPAAAGTFIAVGFIEEVGKGAVLLAVAPDTHVARRAGADVAARVSREAAEVLAAGGVRSARGRAGVAKLDESLRDERNRANPGTTADLTAAAIFVVLLGGGCVLPPGDRVQHERHRALGEGGCALGHAGDRAAHLVDVDLALRTRRGHV